MFQATGWTERLRKRALPNKEPKTSEPDRPKAAEAAAVRGARSTFKAPGGETINGYQFRPVVVAIAGFETS